MYKRLNIFTWGLISLLVFHLIANLAWLGLTQNPVDFDPIGHSLISFNSAEYIKTHLSSISLKDYMRISPAYPNFTHTASLVLIFLFGNHWKVVAFTSTFFFLLAIAAVYLYIKEIAQSAKLAFWGAFFYSFFVSIVQYSRLFMLDIPLTAMVFLTLFVWEKFRRTEDFRYLWISAFTFAFAQLAKWHAIIFLLVPGLFLLFDLYQRQRLFNREFVIRAAGFFLIVIGLTAPWYFYNFASFLRLGRINYLGEADDPQAIFSLGNILFYPKLILIFQTHFLGIVLFALGLVGVLLNLRRRRYLLTPLVTLLFACLFFTFLVPNKNIRVLFPIMPFIALVMAEARSRIFSGIVALYMVVAFFILSFGFPIEPNFKYVRKLPLLGWTDLVYLDTYPVNLSYSKTAIAYNTIVGNLLHFAEDKGIRPKVLVALQQPYFHKDHLILQLYTQKDIGPSKANKLLQEKIELLDIRQMLEEGKTWREIVGAADVVLTAERNPIHPEQKSDFLYQPLKQIQRYLLSKEGPFVPEKIFSLPDGDRVIIYGREKSA